MKIYTIDHRCGNLTQVIFMYFLIDICLAEFRDNATRYPRRAELRFVIELCVIVCVNINHDSLYLTTFL